MLSPAISRFTFPILRLEMRQHRKGWGRFFVGPCALACEAMRAWAERNIPTSFLIACVVTALVWTCSLAIAILHLAALAARP